MCLASLASYVNTAEERATYPVNIGPDLSEDEKIRLVLFLASKHLMDYDSTHCTPLPRHLFKEPYDLFATIGSSTPPSLNASTGSRQSNL